MEGCVLSCMSSTVHVARPAVCEGYSDQTQMQPCVSTIDVKVLHYHTSPIASGCNIPPTCIHIQTLTSLAVIGIMHTYIHMYVHSGQIDRTAGLCAAMGFFCSWNTFRELWHPVGCSHSNWVHTTALPKIKNYYCESGNDATHVPQSHTFCAYRTLMVPYHHGKANCGHLDTKYL